jgi:hypothetical protein
LTSPEAAPVERRVLARRGGWARMTFLSILGSLVFADIVIGLGTWLYCAYGYEDMWEM